MRHYLWKTVRFDVPLKTVYAWYRPHKREAINRNGRSPRICSASPQEAMSRQRGGVGALPAMRHATFRQTSPQNGPRIPTREHQHPVQRFLEQTSAGRDTSIRYVSKCIVQLCLTTDTPDVLKAVRGGAIRSLETYLTRRFLNPMRSPASWASRRTRYTAGITSD